MKGFSILFLVFLVVSRTHQVTLPDPITHSPVAPLVIEPRRLEADSQEQLDDATMFGSTDLKGDTALSSQLLMTSMNQVPINFNQNLENISAQLDVIRRNVDTTLSNQVRISALNAYINNAVLMNNLGLLGDAEDESLINPHADSYIAAKKARKLTKSIRMHVPTGKQRQTKLFKPYASRIKRVMAYKPKNRKLSKQELPPTDNQIQVTTSTPFTSPPERQLSQKWVAVSGQKKVVRKQRNYHVSNISRLRANDEMIELAKKGSLFHVDFGNIYKVSNDDLNKYMEHKEGAAGRNI